ncbi:alpha/beta hydrolase family protein [Leptospira fainei serovar Hurstbridge str. BUT 6]|uniref:Alpha/beta hydrolase family protein n=1 Tax=Leptospira fainei serovar Hurstbridge str. BUT 6 TaxID=1193011 RepID=S3UXU4_9LEPT|nr:alpha/beta fold hydrolase [Leptospira fainei]EPG75226.1 alpha/beta hydrolase family protein [Leptospira fainei serovar Hurstbridge str. BUT 6]
MKLAFKFYPKKKDSTFASIDPILILHGLFGSSKNWVTVAEYLTEFSDVYSLDLRNHGDSPHSSEHTLAAMADDVDEFLADRKISSAILLGHSMGGLTAMAVSLKFPDKVSRLLVEDVAPRDYEFAYDAELSALMIDVSDSKSRQEIDSKMAVYVPDSFIRNFLLMNLERREEGGYRWKLNVEAIGKSRRIFESQFHTGSSGFSKPTFFILGAISGYFRDEDRGLATRYFPNAKFYSIAGGDHYIHFTKAKEFKEIIMGIFHSSEFFPVK